jgi:DNA-binding transcriptional LysR family regulator
MYPQLEVRLNDANPDRSYEQVRQRQVDFAITGSNPSMVGFQSRLLFKEPFFLVCHKEHKLSKQKKLKLEDLAGLDYIRLTYWGSVGQYLQTSIGNVAFKDTGLEVTQIATAAGLVAHNLGVCLVPRAAIPYFDRDLVVAIPLRDPELAMPVYLIWRAASTLSPAASAFVEMLPKSTAQLANPVRHVWTPKAPSARRQTRHTPAK